MNLDNPLGIVVICLTAGFIITAAISRVLGKKSVKGRIWGTLALSGLWGIFYSWALNGILLDIAAGLCSGLAGWLLFQLVIGGLSGKANPK
jgi:hypothetical protein